MGPQDMISDTGLNTRVDSLLLLHNNAQWLVQEAPRHQEHAAHLHQDLHIIRNSVGQQGSGSAWKLQAYRD